ncbi:disulfide bond formation protein B [Altererythrobacter lauratis]|uniref:Disulfide bond formation protein B n=1 Tax=Alteraurantiacibacter lauratis TaxID=2054627 RepID=A0ABV7EGD7_9SPHN
MKGRSEIVAQRLALALPAALLAGAYVSQYGFGLFPCEMCWWQRWPHFAAVALALASFVIVPQRRVLVALAAGGILTSGLIGAFHAGVEYGWWEGITACAVTGTPAGSDPLEAILAQPTVSCSQAPWTLAGISLAGFNALFSIGGAIAIFALLAKKNRK